MTELHNKIHDLVMKYSSKTINYGMPQTEALEAILDALQKMDERIDKLTKQVFWLEGNQK